MKGLQKVLVLVADEGLHRLNVRPNIPEYLNQLWNRRHFIKAEARSKAFSTGRNTYLGKLWLILDPVLQVSFYGLVFGAILRVDRGMDNFIGFLVIGVVYFGFISKAINSGANLIQRSRNLINAFSFPRAAVAISASLRQFLDSIIPAIVAVIIALLFQLDKPVSWSVIFVVPLFVLIHLFGLGAIFIVARLTAFVPDFKSLVALGTRGLFFLSGVFFSLDRFDTHPTLKLLVEMNPIYQFLMAVRTCVLDGAIPNPEVWMYLILWSVVTVIVGFVFFWQAEERYAHVK
ncbi:ABC transporter permease [Corynebacterium sp. S7]